MSEHIVAGAGCGEAPVHSSTPTLKSDPVAASTHHAPNTSPATSAIKVRGTKTRLATMCRATNAAGAAGFRSIKPDSAVGSNNPRQRQAVTERADSLNAAISDIVERCKASDSGCDCIKVCIAGACKSIGCLSDRKKAAAQPASQQSPQS